MVTPVADRVWRLIDQDASGCWLWTGSRDGNGYGMVFVDNARGARRAHRVMYELMVGSIPSGLTLDHLCRVRHCVNPAHLEPVTRTENVLRGTAFSAVNARKTHCKRGHPLTPENLERRVTNRRSCRHCMAFRSREYRKRLAARERGEPIRW